MTTNTKTHLILLTALLLAPLAALYAAEPNEFVFCTRDRMDERYDMMRSVMDQQWLYIHNLAADPAHRQTLERMRAALEKRIIANNDNGFLPEGSQLEGYDASRVPGAYPIERVFTLANLASERKAAHLPKLIAALDDPCEPLRWWAAQGCTMLRDKAAPAENALRQRLADPSGAVQAAAAEALARLGKMDAAMPVLERCQKMDGKVKLQAENVLYRLGKTAGVAGTNGVAP